MKHWIQAARLRTLPLSVSGIIVGSFYALAKLPKNEPFNWLIFALAILTTLGLQILSNFANDYGDGVKGTDNENRIGPKRAIQSGAISATAMKKAIIITALVTFASIIYLLYTALKNNEISYTLFFVLLGVAAIVAAIKYTVGKTAYGYRGLGDIFVFVFFGLVSTLGVHFLFTKQIDLWLFLPAIAIGLLSVGVLNLNNMRDEASDKIANKNTLVVKIGGKNAKIYHYFLLIIAMSCCLIFAIGNKFYLKNYLFLFAFLPFIKHLRTVYLNSEPQKLDPELKTLALSTFALSILLAISFLI